MTINQKVTHKTLGTGTVIAIEKKATYQNRIKTYVRVKFDNNLGEDYRNSKNPEFNNTAVFYEESFEDSRYFTK